jgi:TPR repeat protein
VTLYETKRGNAASGDRAMNIPDLRQKADSGDLASQTALGVCYLEGLGAERNYSDAFRLLSQAAERGASRAMVNLARMYLEGLGVPRNMEAALRWYEGAAEAGEFIAQIELGRVHSRGVLVLKNDGLALRWYSAAAAQEGLVDDPECIQEAKSYILRRRVSR